MHRPLFACLALLGTTALIFAPAMSAPKARPTVSKLQTPPPTIVHTYSRPLCMTLYNTIKPAIGKMIENNANIAKSQPFFEQYNRDVGNGEMADPSRQLTLLRMENLVGPIAKNTISVETSLSNPNIFPNRPRTADEKRLEDIREKLLDTLAAQRAALDIINGFVTTQQLADLQHEGFGYIGALNGTETINSDPRATPMPLFNDPNAAGLRRDSHHIDLATIPGLSLGYNPVRHLIDGLTWTRAQIDAKGSVASKAVIDSAKICYPPAKPTPAPTP